MNCDRLQARLDDYLDGELTAEEGHALEAHARDCGGCRARLARERELREALRRLPVPEPDEAFFDRALAQAASRRPRWVSRHHGLSLGIGAIGGALAASLVLVLGWNLLVGPSGSPAHQEIPGLSIALNEVREVSLVVESARTLDNATFTVLLPEGVELAGFPSQREVSWQGRLVKGENLLVLPIRASAAGDGELVAYVQHTDKRKTFRLKMDVKPASQSQHLDPRPRSDRA